ncbi:MAG TPA: hypothetical protein VHD69_02630 [Candidatus Paceibacterota bacterium]|nr:hypothetical protein [Candidatus Paceibacterota bacterium]
MKEQHREPSGQGGFIMKIVLITVMICIIFILLASAAQYVPKNIGGGTISSPGGYGNSTDGNNPLLGFLDGGTGSYGGSGGTISGGNSDILSGQRSAYVGKVSLGIGNASYSIQPFEEYVTLRNYGGSSVDITGWTLTNSKGTRPIQTSQNNYIYPVADSATIGKGTQFLDPSGRFAIGDIVLAPGDSAIVTTGQAFSQFPYSISTSFRENICEGYLKNYPFEPPLQQSCPYPTNDPNIRSVTDECYDYMQSLNRCEDPFKYDKANYDEQTSQCKAFMDARLSYPACVANHRSDAGFSLDNWRIFLGKGREMWASQRETITLYDARGLIVDHISY